MVIYVEMELPSRRLVIYILTRQAVNLLLITGIKTAMGLDPLKKDNTKKAEPVNVKEQAIVVRKATKPAGMNM